MDMMDMFVDLSWYFVRFIDFYNDEVLFLREKVRKMLFVDFYIGGIEYVILYFLYLRFIYKFFMGLMLVGEMEGV